MKDIDGYVTKDNLYRLISRIKRNPDFVVDDKTCNIILEAISDMSKADVQPVKHGKWIGVDYDTYFECSECKHMTDWQLYKYCPYCGAKMIKDGEQNDD